MVPQAVLVQAPAKLNLRLRVVGRRSDGYHLIDSLMAPISLFDMLEVRAVPAARTRIRISPRTPGVARGGNLAARAARLFLQQVRQRAEVEIKLSKSIPIGAGLGGGSTDAAAVLLALNRIFARRLPRSVLARWGLALGADVPFFVHGCPARVTGIGETVVPLSTRLPWQIVVAFAGAPLSTADVYRVHAGSLTTKGGLSSIRFPISKHTHPEDLLVNDLETAAMTIDPGVRTLKDRLRGLGAAGALMTGSGSAVFGVWLRQAEARSAARRLEQEGIWARMVEILGRSPKMTPRDGR
jgi:4-diphosphocytidyl-2-C-methyl-D-erythritol kinase